MPRIRRSKQYKKLMGQYALLGFREPYQILVDSEFLASSQKCKMDVIRRLEDTLHGQVKPMITQCSMRHLYAQKGEPGIQEAIEVAKIQFERRRCGHHPDEYPEPLSAFECINSVVDPKQTGTNKNRYCCAINDDAVRASLRQIPGVPLLYIRRSVMIMEPMADSTAKARSRDERSKFRAEFRTPGSKRKRDEDESDDEDAANARPTTNSAKNEKKKVKKTFGRKEPNPLSVKRKNNRTTKDPPDQTEAPGSKKERKELDVASNEGSLSAPHSSGEARKRKRRRKHKANGDAGSISQVQEDGAADLETGS